MTFVFPSQFSMENQMKWENKSATFSFPFFFFKDQPVAIGVADWSIVGPTVAFPSVPKRSQAFPSVPSINSYVIVSPLFQGCQIYHHLVQKHSYNTHK